MLSTGQTEAAGQAMRDGLRHGEYLVSQFPESSLYRKNVAWTRYHLGELLHQTGDPEEAAGEFKRAFEQFEEIVRRFPDNPRGHDHFAWVLLTCPDQRLHDPERAIGLAGKAIELRPDAKGHWHTMGLAYYRAGQWPEAIAALAKAPEDGYTWFGLAMAHRRAGHHRQAREFHARGVKWMEENSPLDINLGRFRAESATVLGLEEEAAAVTTAAAHSAENGR